MLNADVHETCARGTVEGMANDDASMIDMDRARALAAARMPLTADKCGGEALLLEEVGSTNTVARELVARGVPVRVVAADRQVSGRGRLDHVWVSDAGKAFTVTFVNRVPRAVATDPEVNGWIQMIAGLAALDGVRGALGHDDVTARGDVSVALKWPNDLYCDGRKLGGILAEMVVPPDAGEGLVGAGADDVAIVFGIGINLDVPSDRLPAPQATSLESCSPGIVGRAGGADRLRDVIAAGIVRMLGLYLDAFARDPRGSVEGLRDRVTAESWMFGKPVEAHFTDGSTLRGEAVALGMDASLTVRTPDGADHVVRTADVGVLA